MNDLTKQFEGMEIPKEKFEMVQGDKKIQDVKLSTKPVSYFKDAWLRFKKNKSSIVAAGIIALMLIFAILVSLFSRYGIKDYDLFYAKALPKIFSGGGFWDGTNVVEASEPLYEYYNAMGVEQAAEGAASGRSAVKKVYKSYTQGENDRKFYKIRLDSYAKVGYVYLNLDEKEYLAMQKYQDDNKVQVLYPMPKVEGAAVPSAIKDDPNYWYKITMRGKSAYAAFDKDGNYIPSYYTNRTDHYDSLRIQGDNGTYAYAIRNQTGYKVRVLYSEYYEYVHGYQAKFVFGASGEGKDMMVNICTGLLFSIGLAVIVCLINMLIGAVYGAVEGYYGGMTDLAMERFSDILSSMPQIVLITLFQLHFAKSVGPVVSLLFAFVTFGWIGIASKVRTQFYRFKGREYVLAARTLGASDKRLIFRHIYPNSLGTLITSSILMIPGFIFTESTFTYLGIVDLGSTGVTSLGTLLSNGQSFLATFPHIILIPGIFIALLMISFNLFGNGLRDAFNPSLRGSEE